MLSIFQHKGKLFKHGEGVIDKETRNKDASTPEEAIKLLNTLYKLKGSKGFTQKIIQNFEKLYDHIQKNLSKTDAFKIIGTYLKILDITRVDIPYELQQEWIKRQSELGLTGKFLPDDSELIPHKK